MSDTLRTINDRPFARLFLDSSHDLRSPQVTLKSFLGICEMSNYELSSDELKEFCQHLSESSNRWFALMERLFLEANNINDTPSQP